MTKSLRALTALLAVLVALLASGCSQQLPATVAMVDGQRVTESQVDGPLEVFRKATPETSEAELRTFVMQYLVLDKMMPTLQRKLGVTVSDAEAADVLPKILEGMPDVMKQAYRDPAAQPVTKAISRWQALVHKVSNRDKLIAAVNEVKVDLNPRYGAWPPADPGSDIGFGSLSKLWESPAAPTPTHK